MRRNLFEPGRLVRRAADFACRMLPDLKEIKYNIINPRELLQSPESILVCMPLKEEAFPSTIPFLDGIVSRFPQSRFGFIVWGSFRHLLQPHHSAEVISVSEADVNIFRLPRKGLRNRLRENEYQIAIDLNPGDILFSSILCGLSGADVRVGFIGKNRDRFFNFLVHPRINTGELSRYQALLQYL